MLPRNLCVGLILIKYETLLENIEYSSIVVNVECLIKSIDILVQLRLSKFIKLFTMNLFQYILLPFGLSLKHKTLDFIFTGISVSTLGILFMTHLLALPKDYLSFNAVLSKISGLVLFCISTRAYIHLKKCSEDIYGMFDAILVFERNKTPKERLKFGFSLISFISCFMSSYVLSLSMILLFDEINHLYQPFNINLHLYHHAAITDLYFIYWMFVIQFIYFEFCNKYYNLMKFSTDIIERFVSFRPHFVIRYQINEVIDNFIENDKQFAENVNPLRLYIILMSISLNFQILFSSLYMFEVGIGPNIKYLLILFGFVMNLYLISTQIVIQFKSKIQNILIKNINVWRNTDESVRKVIILMKNSK